MAPAFLLLIQAVYGPPVPAASRPPGVRPAVPTCPTTARDDHADIVVCASRAPGQRLGSIPDRPAAPDPLSFRLPGGGRGDVAASQSNVGGFTGAGAKVTLRIPFGRGRRD